MMGKKLNQIRDDEKTELQLEQLDQVAGGGDEMKDFNISEMNHLAVDYNIGGGVVQLFAYRDSQNKWQGVTVDGNANPLPDEAGSPYCVLTDDEILHNLQDTIDEGMVVGITARNSIGGSSYSYGDIRGLV